MKKIFVLTIFFIIHAEIYSQVNICVQASNQLLENSCTRLAVEDAIQLFSKTPGCSIVNNSSSADLTLQLPEYLPKTDTSSDAYKWERNNNTWKMLAYSHKGIANGIYGLMQEMLGFKFYHPRETIIPDYNHFTFPEIQTFKGEPSFANIGFHLHTMHPIELTEDLLDEKREGGLERVYEYIDWLARNGQNYFEFNVLESINLETWIFHAKKISDYAHQRGIKSGLDLSLHMLQQKAFQLYEAPPFKFSKVEKQIDYNVSMLVKTGFDVWNVELSATEFTSGNQVKKKKILQHLTELLNNNNIQLMSRNHVVKPDQMINDGNGEKAGDILAPGQGLMVHTVMFYSLTDEKAPVYRNKNLRHMYDIMQEEKTKRPVWYFPESAYWVTFDNSVPMFLLPYFKARLSDIELCEKENIQGHLTFSSGWEWGYGLIDWSIARWCWNYQTDNLPIKRKSLQYLHELVSPEFYKYLEQEEKLQQEYIKDKELIRVMVAQTITDEIPGPFNLEFHPRPLYSYKFIRNKASLQQLDTVTNTYIAGLYEYYGKFDLNDKQFIYENLNQVEKEVFDGILITHLRAKHKMNTLMHIIHHRKKQLTPKTENKIQSYLEKATSIREEGIVIVRRRESKYRYDLNLLSTKHNDHTCYHFGYLYPVHDLHFWKREELQAKNGNYNFWYKSIWNVGRTVGLFD